MQYLHLKFSKHLEQPPDVVSGNVPITFQNLSLIMHIGLFVYENSYLSTFSTYEKIRANTQVKIYSTKKENLKEGNKLELMVKENPLLCWNNVLPTWQMKKEKRKYNKKKNDENSSEISCNKVNEESVLKDLFETLDKK